MVFFVKKLLLKRHGVQIPFPENPSVQLQSVYEDKDEGRILSRPENCRIPGFTTGHNYELHITFSDKYDIETNSSQSLW